MKYTLTYRNKQGVEARLDIITHGIYSQTEIIEGTDTPFILNYKREKNNKDGYIISSSADISIYESGTFNIDNLKTSNETDIKVEYYIDNVLMWSGFVVPDFFSREIGTPAIINMVASDRLGSLKGQTLDNLPATITLSSLVSLCLEKTGLSLSVNLKADFTSVAGNENIFKSKVLSQRFTDTKGRNISCYDILYSILVATNSIIVQRNSEWYVINKFQIEQEDVLPTQQYIDFDEVTVGARRQIIPVASNVGVYHEFGGERRHPQNFDFSEELAGWTAVNGFDGEVKNKEIIEFTRGETIEPVYGVNDTMPYLLITNTKPENRLMYGEDGWNFEDAPYLKSTFPVISLNESIVNITFDAGLIGSNSSLYYFLVIAKNRNDATDIYALNKRGLFTEYDFHSDDFAISKVLEGEKYYTPVTGVKNIVGKFEAENVKDYDIELRIYPATALRFNGDVIVGVNYASIMFNNETEIPKGNIYKTTQGDSFTKQHDTDTSVIGDYLTSGLNGYFYPYPIDDTSSLLTSSGDLTTRWMAPGITEELPLLQHVTRQRSRMFSVAHDLLSAEINSDILDPLAIFRDCSGKRYVLVSGSQDFLRGVINVEIEEIAYDLEIWKRDYIYSYFGEGEEGISSVGGISESAPSAGGGTGGGLTPEQLEILSFWKKDPDNPNTIFTEMNAYSKGELSAYGIDSGGSSGGGSYDRLDAWADYDSTKSGWVLSALLGNELNTRVGNLDTRVGNLEGGSALTVNTTGTGNAITSISKSGTVITASKDLTFSLSGHTHTISDISGLQTTLNSKLETSIFNTHNTDNARHITGAERTKWDGVVTDFGNLEIGGRNLGIGTGEFDTVNGNIRPNYYNSFGELQTERFRDNKVYKTTTNFNGFYFTLPETFEPTIISFYAKVNEGQTCNFGCFTGTTNYIKSSPLINSSVFKQYWMYFPTGVKFNDDSHHGVVEFFDGYAYYTSIQVEKGTHPTDWTPAPEDVEAEIDAVQTNLITHATNTSNPHSVTKAQVGLGNVDNTADSVKNVLSATKLQTPRTIWGQSFDGTRNVTGALSGATTIEASISVTAPKVIFNAAGWSMEQVGDELQMKHNNVLKMRFTSTGSIVATEEITAFG